MTDMGKADYRVNVRRETFAQLQELADSGRKSLAEVVTDLVGGDTPGLPVGGTPASAPSDTPPDRPEGTMSDCVDCKLKDRDLVDRDKRITDLTTELEGEKKAHAFGSFPEVLAHAKSGSCPGCKTALEELAEGMARTTLTELDDKALRDLAIQRGVMPETIKVEIPSHG